MVYGCLGQHVWLGVVSSGQTRHEGSMLIAAAFLRTTACGGAVARSLWS
jgi:hypothetical protein